MRWGLVTIRILMAVVSLIIAALIVLSVMPLATGNLKIDVPSNTSEPTYQDGIVTYHLPVDVYNGGYFDITNFKLGMKVTDGALLISDQTTAPMDIKVGKDNHLDLSLQMDLNDLPADVLSNLVFNQTTLGVDIRAEGTYTMGLVRATVHSTQSMNWDPLVSEVSVDTGSATIAVQGADLVIKVPFSFQASQYIQGKTVQVDATLRNATTELGTASKAITIQESNQGTLDFVISGPVAVWLMTHSDELTVGMDVGFEGASAHMDYAYHWEGMA